LTWYYRNIILQRINSIVVLCTRIVVLLESLLCWWAEFRTMLCHLNRWGLNGITWALLTVYNLQCIINTFSFHVDAVVCQNNGQFQVWELNIWQFIVIVEIRYFLNLNEYYLPIFILSIHFRHILFVKITKDIQSNNNNNIVLSMLYAEICPTARRYNALPFGSWIMPSNLGTYFGI
jgi:hypothetical protein